MSIQNTKKKKTKSKTSKKTGSKSSAEIKTLKKKNVYLKRKISYLEQKLGIKKSAEKKRKRITKTTVHFKIKTDDIKQDLHYFFSMMQDFELQAKKKQFRLEYKIKEGCIDVTLYVISILTGVISSALYEFLKHVIGRLRDSPNTVKVQYVPEHYKESRAKEMHEELGRSYNGIIERKSIKLDDTKGTRYKIRDNNNVDWSYDLLDNGDERALG